MNPSPRLILALLLILFAASAVFAQISIDPERDVPLTVTVSPDPVPEGGSGTLKVVIQLPPNHHITSRDNGFFFVTPDSGSRLSWGLAGFPPGETYKGERVYQGSPAVIIPFTLPPDAKSGASISISGMVGYQICSEGDPEYCTPPIERKFSTSIAVGAAGAAPSTPAPNSGGEMTIEKRATRALESGSLMALLWVFLGGVALSFTPCVYPVIPITIAYIGGRSGGSKARGLSISLVFVLGLAIVYSTLGVIAAATGGVFGLNTQNPIVIGFVTIVFLVMGVGMLGAFRINLPSSMQTALVNRQRSGYLGAIFVGGTTGLIAAPCVGPVLVALLGWVASTGRIFLGFIYLFVFALGLGSLFVLIGTFAGALTNLPKAGQWMDHVKHFFGVVLLAAAFYFGRGIVSPHFFLVSVGFGLIFLATLFKVFHKSDDDEELDILKVGRHAGAVFLLVAGVFFTFLGLARMNDVSFGGSASTTVASAPAKKIEGSEAAGLVWIHDDEAKALADSKASGKPIIIDFWAEWCVACMELDHETFSDPAVVKYLNDNFIPLKIDGTRANGPVKEIWAKFKVRGLPTVLFLRPDGSEIERFEAFRTVSEAMPVLQRVAGK